MQENIDFKKNINTVSDNQTAYNDIKPWKVLQCIPGSNGSLSEIAVKLGVSRTALRRFLENNPKIQEEIDDEREASVERIMRQQYDEAMDGNMQARESYIKMVSGYFSKNSEKKENLDDKVMVNIVMPEAPSERQMAIDPETHQLVELDENLEPIDKGSRE